MNNNEKYSIQNNTTGYNQGDIQKIVIKVGAILSIIMSIVWILIIFCIFYLPKYIDDTVPTTYILNGKTVSKQEFYDNPIPLIFMLLGFVPLIICIIRLIKFKNNN